MAKLWVLILTDEIHSLHQNSKLASTHSKFEEPSLLLKLVTELTHEQLSNQSLQYESCKQ
jgi:hypothetical protein